MSADAGIARAREELTAGRVSPPVAAALLALLTALDVAAAEPGGGEVLIERFRREMAALASAER